MPDLSCAICGEPWDAYGVRHGDMLKWESALFLKGAGCPSCEGQRPEHMTDDDELDVLRDRLLINPDESGDPDLIERLTSGEAPPPWERPEPEAEWTCACCGVMLAIDPDDGEPCWVGDNRVHYWSGHAYSYPDYPEAEDASDWTEGGREIAGEVYCPGCSTTCRECDKPIFEGPALDQCQHDSCQEGANLGNPTSHMARDALCYDCFVEASSENDRDSALSSVEWVGNPGSQAPDDWTEQILGDLDSYEDADDAQAVNDALRERGWHEDQDEDEEEDTLDHPPIPGMEGSLRLHYLVVGALFCGESRERRQSSAEQILAIIEQAIEHGARAPSDPLTVESVGDSLVTLRRMGVATSMSTSDPEGPVAPNLPVWSGRAPTVERGGLTCFFRRDERGKPIEDELWRWVCRCEIPSPSDHEGRRALMGTALAAELGGKSGNPNTVAAGTKLHLILDGLMALEGR